MTRLTTVCGDTQAPPPLQAKNSACPKACVSQRCHVERSSGGPEGTPKARQMGAPTAPPPGTSPPPRAVISTCCNTEASAWRQSCAPRIGRVHIPAGPVEDARGQGGADRTTILPADTHAHPRAVASGWRNPGMKTFRHANSRTGLHTGTRAFGRLGVWPGTAVAQWKGGRTDGWARGRMGQWTRGPDGVPSRRHAGPRDCPPAEKTTFGRAFVHSFPHADFFTGTRLCTPAC